MKQTNNKIVINMNQSNKISKNQNVKNNKISDTMQSNKINQHLLQSSQTNINNIIQKGNQFLTSIEYDIFKYLNVQYEVNEIKINQKEFLHTIYIQSNSYTLNQQKKHCFYLTHGFGGSSLMYFPIINFLLEFGNIVLWEIRGMGFSKKLSKYHIKAQQAQIFFIAPIELMLDYYKHNSITFISHSFGAYLSFNYLLNPNNKFQQKIKQFIFLSCVGITPSQRDYKLKVNNLSDIFHVIGNKISWTFGITYKSPFRCICSCFKQKVFREAVKNIESLNELQKQLMKQLLLSLVSLPDGSQSVFFQYFLPRVLPKYSLEEKILKQKPEIKNKIFIIYGGQQDWVDKTGSYILQDYYPEIIKIKIYENCGHNFPFFPMTLKNILSQIIINNKQNKNKRQQFQKQKNEQQSFIGQNIQDIK